MTNQRIILTGGPGSGKSTLIDALTRLSYACSIEAGRAIIQEQVASGGNALPWEDRQAFAELMLSREIRAWHSAGNADAPYFFDRGIPDVAGYLTLCQLPVPAHLEQAIAHFRYAERVFITPPWREIYAQDAERRQSFAEAEMTYRVMRATYQQHGYRLLELPRAPLDKRVNFILAALRSD
ncbi:AAA family ATPase [Serratia rhizosphaerae]|uniref:AAA family ATPase n=1 Tax=Serratia rhizosphaerae TaxID=2597702 RepID=UPI002DBD49A7|nr:AAA family ATPase [Serratia rhizosphaerae]MEB6335363.1 AAA family ATPase [Serratia rhizosphaerae]